MVYAMELHRIDLDGIESYVVTENNDLSRPITIIRHYELRHELEKLGYELVRITDDCPDT